jgi:hypothetical protein
MGLLGPARDFRPDRPGCATGRASPRCPVPGPNAALAPEQEREDLLFELASEQS